jgi:hypothetical protein
MSEDCCVFRTASVTISLPYSTKPTRYATYPAIQIGTAISVKAATPNTVAIFPAHSKTDSIVTISLLLMGCAGAEGPCALKSGDGARPIYVRVADLILPALKLLNDGFRNQMLRHPHYRPVASCQILPVARKTSAFASESYIYERI